ncbi:MAG: transmembrane anchor protein [Alphaproteobacteria bacterium]|nr:transmembrane anchor protein [Alphaproteobacteria bacterium]
MYNANIPDDRELPSTKKLVKSTIIAAAVASALLVTVVMPAEYGIDPTGIGKVTGLKTMGEIKMSLAEEAAREKMTAADVAKLASSAQPLSQVAKLQPVSAAEAATPVEQPSAPVAAKERSDETKVTLAPDQGTEVKVTLKKGEKVHYEWTSTGKVNFDNHADSKELNIDYHGYGKGVGQASDKGVIEAAFDGHHGWFWRNRTKETVTLTLKTTGAYTDINRMK